MIKNKRRTKRLKMSYKLKKTNLRPSALTPEGKPEKVKMNKAIFTESEWKRELDFKVITCALSNTGRK